MQLARLWKLVLRRRLLVQLEGSRHLARCSMGRQEVLAAVLLEHGMRGPHPPRPLLAGLVVPPVEEVVECCRRSLAEGAHQRVIRVFLRARRQVALRILCLLLMGELWPQHLGKLELLLQPVDLLLESLDFLVSVLGRRWSVLRLLYQRGWGLFGTFNGSRFFGYLQQTISAVVVCL